MIINAYMTNKKWTSETGTTEGEKKPIKDQKKTQTINGKKDCGGHVK